MTTINGHPIDDEGNIDDRTEGQAPLGPEEEREVRDLWALGETGENIEPSVIGSLIATLDRERAANVQMEHLVAESYNAEQAWRKAAGAPNTLGADRGATPDDAAAIRAYLAGEGPAPVRAETLDYEGLPDLLRNDMTGDDISMVPLHDRLILWRSHEWSRGFHKGRASIQTDRGATPSLRAALERSALDLHNLDHRSTGPFANCDFRECEQSRAALHSTDTSPRSNDAIAADLDWDRFAPRPSPSGGIDVERLARLESFAEKVTASPNDTAGTRAAARYALTGSLDGVVWMRYAARLEARQEPE